MSPPKLTAGPSQSICCGRMFQGPVFHAWLELIVASRTDKALREALRAMNERFQGDLKVYFKEIFGPSPLTTDFDLIPAFIFSLMEGMAMRSIVGNDEENQRILESAQAIRNLVPRRPPSDRNFQLFDRFTDGQRRGMNPLRRSVVF